jgi:hypothetical protein
MAAGDFDGDGFDDIAVTAETHLHTFRGTRLGPRFGRAVIGLQYYDYHREVSGNWSIAAHAATAGDYNGDGFDDLVLAGYNDELRRYLVYLVPGSSKGLVTSEAQQLGQGDLDTDEPFDRFGLAMATTDIDGDLKDDLIVGAPNESLNGRGDCGAVYVFQGNGSAMPGENHAGYVTPWTLISPTTHVGLSCFNVDDFGLGLAARFTRIALGVPGKQGTGAVDYFNYNASTGNFDYVRELTPDPINNTGQPALFGSSLVYLARKNSTGPDLAVAAYRENNEAGGVYVFASPQYARPNSTAQRAPNARS